MKVITISGNVFPLFVLKILRFIESCTNIKIEVTESLAKRKSTDEKSNGLTSVKGGVVGRGGGVLTKKWNLRKRKKPEGSRNKRQKKFR